MRMSLTVGVVGNPNCGKTTLFNALTGSRQRVGNWPGVTVERKTGRFRAGDTLVELVDLPGTYSLDVTDHDLSLDERIARDFIHAREADLILNILDATNLERNLYLTTQLIEMGRPMVVALNMIDAARERGLLIDAEIIARHLGCPVVPISAATGEGLDALRHALCDRGSMPGAKILYPPAIEQTIAGLIPRVEAVARSHGDASRWLAARLLEGDDLAIRLAGDLVSAQDIRTMLGDQAEDIDILIADARYGFAHLVTHESVAQVGAVSRDLSERIDRVILNRMLGIPIFLAIMYLMFMFTINLGGAFIDAFDLAAGILFVEGTTHLLEAIGSPAWLTFVLADGIGRGLQVVATFVPIIGFLFIFMSVLEDSGYMARAAFVMDRFMRAIGLPGKSFVPLLVGFGCNVPAIMATRTLENQRDRTMTVLMAPFMSCGARLPVYVLFAAAFFPTGGQNLVFALYLIGIAVAVLTGFIMKATLLKGQATPFVMELPPYHLPTLRGVSLRTLDRTKGFVIRAGQLIVPMVLVLNVLSSVGTDGSFGNEDSDQSILAGIGRTLAPAFAPMGLDADNWPATVGIITGVLAKEAVVGTLDATYSALAATDLAFEEAAQEGFDLVAGLIAAAATIPANLADALGGWRDPLGFDELSEAEALQNAASAATFGAMAERFDGTAGAFAYLLFILLYAPCVAAIAAIYRETTAGWTVFAVLWTTGLAYSVATITYQAAIFARDPSLSATWIAVMLATFAGVVIGMRLWAQRLPAPTQLARESA